jgi:hypothetical protein
MNLRLNQKTKYFIGFQVIITFLIIFQANVNFVDAASRCRYACIGAIKDQCNGTIVDGCTIASIKYPCQLNGVVIRCCFNTGYFWHFCNENSRCTGICVGSGAPPAINSCSKSTPLGCK